MFDEQPDAYGQDQPQGKLILPAPDSQAAAFPPQENTVYVPQEQTLYAPPQGNMQQTFYPPAQPMYQQQPMSPPPPPYMPQAKARGRWSDPAYKLLLIAIIVVIISGIIFATAFAAGNFLASRQGQNTTRSSQSPNSGNPPSAATTTAPTPTPLPTATPTPQPTVQVTATPDQNGQLTLQITGIPQQVQNFTTVPVTVTASQPGIRVRLLVSYNVPPFTYKSTSKRIDDTGSAQLFWHVNVHPFNQGNNGVTANVTVAAFDQDGQQIQQSDPTQVQVMTGGDNGG